MKLERTRYPNCPRCKGQGWYMSTYEHRDYTSSSSTTCYRCQTQNELLEGKVFAWANQLRKLQPETITSALSLSQTECWLFWLFNCPDVYSWELSGDDLSQIMTLDLEVFAEHGPLILKFKGDKLERLLIEACAAIALLVHADEIEKRCYL